METKDPNLKNMRQDFLAIISYLFGSEEKLEPEVPIIIRDYIADISM